MDTPPRPALILIIDDDDSIRTMIRSCLEHVGHRVYCANGRTRVLDALARHRFDLVITDIIMPELDGTEVIELVKQLQPAAAILAISAGGKHLSAKLCLTLAKGMGATVPLSKPFHMNELLLAVDGALYGSRILGD